MNTKRKDYDEVYNKYSDCGFLFYYDKRISKSHVLTREDMKRISIGKGNGDKLFVVCGHCDLFMEFEAGKGELEGWWVCPECGARMRERTAYAQLDRENEEFLRQHDLDDESFEELYE